MEAQIEEAIKFRKKANFKILTRLSQIIDQYPYLRFQERCRVCFQCYDCR